MNDKLKKGVAQRKMPFNPLSVPKNERKPVEDWTYGEGSRDNVPELKGPARERGLLKLHGKTQVRRNPNTGEREFLLHRGKTISDVRSGGLEKLSSFTTDPNTAHFFNRDSIDDLSTSFNDHVGNNATLQDLKHEYSQLPDHTEKKSWAHRNFGHIYSAWVPESAIHHIPNALGSLIHENVNKINGVPGPQHRKDEGEVIVNTDKVPNIEMNTAKDFNKKYQKPTQSLDVKERIRNRLFKSITTLEDRIKHKLNLVNKDEVLSKTHEEIKKNLLNGNVSKEEVIKNKVLSKKQK